MKLFGLLMMLKTKMKFTEYNEIPGDQYEDEMMMINDENRDNYESMNDDCQLDLSFIITPTKHVNINVENEKNTNWAPRNVFYSLFG